jgi:hypothetical protein
MGKSAKPRKPGARPNVAAVLAKARNARSQVIAKKNARTARANNLPLGHPVNAHKLHKTFAPIEQMLAENEKTGSMMFDADGVAVLWVQDEQCWTPIVTGLLEMCHAFQLVGQALAWGAQPPGLRAFSLKLGREEVLGQHDIADARVTVGWMRQRIAGVTPSKWADTLAEAQAIEARKDAA